MKCEDLTALGEKLGNLARNKLAKHCADLDLAISDCLWNSAKLQLEVLFHNFPRRIVVNYTQDDIEGKPGYDHVKRVPAGVSPCENKLDVAIDSFLISELRRRS